MVCYYPLKAYRSKSVNPKTGKRKMVFNYRDSLDGISHTLPCGQCIGCRLEKSRQWAMRCMHEASLHDDNCFITLTYNDENLPENGSLDVSHFQKFMKRLRERIGVSIRFFHCGEYGDTTLRPHYHALIFGYDFPDKTLWSIRNGNRLYVSPFLDKVWKKGHTSVGSLTFESAAYVARYAMKKVTGEQAQEHYRIADPKTGEVFDRLPEYTTMSLRPAIAAGWYKSFKSDVYPRDYVVVNGVKVKPPRFYDILYEIDDPPSFEKIKRARKRAALLHKQNNTPERLRVRERVLKAKISTLKRGLD
ncbi:putative replication initiation protein [Eel River basin pequenovirus]|nr:putative replication initiation protein [Eel River basin pequenovirus]